MASIHGGHDWRAIVVQDGDGPPRAVAWLSANQPDPTAQELQGFATAYALNQHKFGTPVLARVVTVMAPGPLGALLSDYQYEFLEGINADGSVGTPQTNLDPATSHTDPVAVRVRATETGRGHGSPRPTSRGSSLRLRTRCGGISSAHERPGVSRKARDAILSAIYESTFLGILRGVAVMQHDVNERIEESAKGNPDARRRGLTRR